MQIAYQPTLVPNIARAATLDYTDGGEPARSITMFNVSVSVVPATAPATGFDATVSKVDGDGNVMTDGSGAITATENGATEAAAILAAASTLAPRVLPVPTITQASPATGAAAGGTSVAISGTNLTGATAVKFGGVDAEGFTVDGPMQITATTPAGEVDAVDVTVTAPGGTASLKGGFAYE